MTTILTTKYAKKRADFRNITVILGMIAVMMFVLGTTGCSKADNLDRYDEQEPSEQEDAALNVPKADHSEDDILERKEVPVLENDVTDPVDNSWKVKYEEVIDTWEEKYDRKALGYDFIFFNDDAIPELVIYCEDYAWEGIDIYTVIDGEVLRLDRYDMDGNSEMFDETILTCSGRQGQGDSYINKSGILIQSGGMMGSYWTCGYQMDAEGKLDRIFEHDYIDMSWDEEETPVSYELCYKKSDGSVVNIRKEEDIYFEDCPECKDIGSEYGFSFEESYPLSVGGLLLSREDAEKYLKNDVEPENKKAAAAYMELIKEFAPKYKKDKLKYNLICMTDCGIKSLVIESPGEWISVYSYKEGNLVPILDKKKCGGDIMEFYSYNSNGAGKIIRGFHGEMDGKEVQVREVYEVTDKGVMVPVFDSPLYYYHEDNEPKYFLGEEEISGEKFDEYTDSKSPYSNIYGIYDTKEMLRNLEEIAEREYSVKDGAEDTIEPERVEQNDMYIVLVDAPDGYVNFRKGPGTEHDIISEITNGNELYVLEEKGKWLKVRYAGAIGYVAVSQVKKEDKEDEKNRDDNDVIVTTVSADENQPVYVDLDGDGKAEHIEVKKTEEEDFLIYIDGKLVYEEQDNWELSKLIILDTDVRDNYLDMCLESCGMWNSVSPEFYRYDGDRFFLYATGPEAKHAGVFTEIETDQKGDGTVKCKECIWENAPLGYYWIDTVLKVNGGKTEYLSWKDVNTTEDWQKNKYIAIGANNIYTDKSGGNKKFTLTSGDVFHLLAVDNVENPKYIRISCDGEIGWMKIPNVPFYHTEFCTDENCAGCCYQFG